MGMYWHHDCGIYFVECAGFVKIGRAMTVMGRLTALRTSCPLPMEPLGFIYVPDCDRADVLESLLHGKFSSSWHRGEWFRDSPEIRAFIREVAYPWPETRQKGRQNARRQTVTESDARDALEKVIASCLSGKAAVISAVAMSAAAKSAEQIA
jgi:hypothetical protein